MRKFIALFGAFFLFLGLNAQIRVIETERSMSFGTRPCFRMEFGNTQPGTVEDGWKNFVKQQYGGKVKKDKKTGEWTAAKLSSSAVGDDPFTVYATVEKLANGSALNVWYDLGSYFLNRRDSPGRTQEVKNRLEDLYVDIRRAALGEEVKAEEQKLKEMENKQKKLQRDTDNLRKDIESYKAKIKKAEEDIAKNDRDQEAMLRDMEAQQRLIEERKRRLENVENEGGN